MNLCNGTNLFSHVHILVLVIKLCVKCWNIWL